MPAGNPDSVVLAVGDARNGLANTQVSRTSACSSVACHECFNVLRWRVKTAILPIV